MDEYERRVEFGRKLRQLRKEKKLTAKELGEKFGLAPTTISGYEQGYRVPDMEIVVRFAEFFGVSVDYLVSLNRDDSNVREILSRRDLTWDGVPLDEKDLEKVRDFVSWLIWKRTQEKDSNE